MLDAAACGALAPGQRRGWWLLNQKLFQGSLIPHMKNKQRMQSATSRDMIQKISGVLEDKAFSWRASWRYTTDRHASTREA